MLLSMDTLAAADSKAENESLGDELKGNKRKVSLAKCGVCGYEESRYRCPGCLKHSCSLSCVKKHKEESGCSGVRDKTAFVALSKMDEMNLLSDYRFLEDTGRMADSASRDTLVRGPPVNFRAKRLTAQARRLNITLRFLPKTFSKSRENSTICLKKENRFLWHLKLLFPQSSSEFTERRVSDDQTLEQILTPYIHPTESEPVRRQKLKMYVHSPFDHIRVFMKVEGRKANSVRYLELDVAKTLKDNLKFQLVIEYPSLHILLKDHCQDYPVTGPEEAVSARGCPTMEGRCRGDSRTKEEGTGASQSPLPGSSPDTEPPKEKRAKMEPKELEDGEIVDTDEEDGVVDKTEEERVGGRGGSGDEEMTADGLHGDCQDNDNPNNVHIPGEAGVCSVSDAGAVDVKMTEETQGEGEGQSMTSADVLTRFPINSHAHPDGNVHISHYNSGVDSHVSNSVDSHVDCPSDDVKAEEGVSDK
ncbi:box C/D snoRNA protein 1 [Esox lucius]|uniref:Box C/D snoRNA protein 1 n=1 Tax=Esox lucius TaxID=8010 RepID=A0A3P9ALK8_ESOLU|nr:box C/D snoRNA protein 1 [Esox lucius]